MGTAAYVLGGGGQSRLDLAWRNGSAGNSPVLAAGLLYVYDAGGSLRIYHPVSGRRLISLATGSGHWNSPIVVAGRIVMPLGDANAHSNAEPSTSITCQVGDRAAGVIAWLRQ